MFDTPRGRNLNVMDLVARYLIHSNAEGPIPLNSDLTGIGDIALTGTNPESRNFSLGYALAQGQSPTEELDILLGPKTLGFLLRT